MDEPTNIMPHPRLFFAKRLAKGLAFSILTFAFLLVLFQDVILFPGVVGTYLNGSSANEESPPEGVQEFQLMADNGRQLNVWKLPGDGAGLLSGSGYVAIVFHGNGSSLGRFIALQHLFGDLGISSYALDYPGYGKSTGWPREKTILEDAQRLWSFVKMQERTKPANLIVLGQSIGSGPASWLASNVKANTLVLVSPYESIVRAMETSQTYKWFAPALKFFLRYKFANVDRVSEMVDTNLILVHGESDVKIPASHSKSLAKAYKGNKQLVELYDQESGHNEVFFKLAPRIKEELVKLLGGGQQ